MKTFLTSYIPKVQLSFSFSFYMLGFINSPIIYNISYIFIRVMYQALLPFRPRTTHDDDDDDEI